MLAAAEISKGLFQVQVPAESKKILNTEIFYPKSYSVLKNLHKLHFEPLLILNKTMGENLLYLLILQVLFHSFRV